MTPQMAASLPFSLIGCLGVRRSNWHGTHVAGTIASVTDNGLGGAARCRCRSSRSGFWATAAEPSGTSPQA